MNKSLKSLLAAATIFALAGQPALRAAEPDAAKPAPKRQPRAAAASGPAAGTVVGENRATPVERIRAMKDFKVELLYSVPFATEGSWVNMTTDDKGRILASDQYGGLFRFPAPAPGQPLDPSTVEKLPTNIRAVNGMLFAFGALYVGVNDYEKKIPSGLYRLSNSPGSDTFDKVEHLVDIESGGDHGAHAVLLSPDGKSLFFVVGNRPAPAKFTDSRVWSNWGEDHVLPRMPDGRGFMRDKLAPGGIIYNVSPDGKKVDVYASGFRNIFDAAFNADGELFTYDADMEYDYNTSWYRPTRVCHVVSGAEYGWRNGAGKRPEFYPDNLPPVLNIGPGSPTGMTFGYGAKFPAKYQNALFMLDWSWGKLYAVHMKPSGATYTAVKEEFLSGAPLPLTDAIIHPRDGAMYFLIGGRKVQSGLYRVTYTGSESTAKATPQKQPTPEAELRHKLEQYHLGPNPQAIADAWPNLAHADRFIRWAARTAIEHQPVKDWADRVWSETDAAKQLEALLAITQVVGIDPQHRKPTDPPVDTATGQKVFAALTKIDFSRLTDEQRLVLVRTYGVALVRFGRPDDATVSTILAQLDNRFPGGSRELNWLLCETLAALQSPTLAAKAVALIETAPTQEEQIEYARSIRCLKAGWTPEAHRKYLGWFLKAANYRGGASFEKFIEFIKTDAVASLTPDEKVAMKDVIDAKPVKQNPGQAMAAAMFAGREAHEWKLDEIAPAAESGMKGRSFENGRKLFGAAGCFTCHRYGNEGGMTGPDLTGAGGRYSPRDLLDQIINPSKEINEQFAPMSFTLTNGRKLTGTIVNLQGDTIRVQTDPAAPDDQTAIDRKSVVSMEPSKVSPMPTNLLDLMTKDEVLDLVAYVLSAGNPQAEQFKK